MHKYKMTETTDGYEKSIETNDLETLFVALLQSLAAMRELNRKVEIGEARGELEFQFGLMRLRIAVNH